VGPRQTRHRRSRAIDWTDVATETTDADRRESEDSHVNDPAGDTWAKELLEKLALPAPPEDRFAFNAKIDLLMMLKGWIKKVRTSQHTISLARLLF
jgi:hypothetical protein